MEFSFFPPFVPIFFIFHCDHASCFISKIFYLRNAIYFLFVFILHWLLLRFFTTPFPFASRFISRYEVLFGWFSIPLNLPYPCNSTVSSCNSSFFLLFAQFPTRNPSIFFYYTLSLFYLFFSFFLTFVLSFLNNNHIFLWLIVKIYIDLDKKLVINHYYRNIKKI